MPYKKILISLILISILFLTACDKEYIKPETLCEEICSSHNETLYKVSGGGYANNVCVCKTKDLIINTYTI